MIKNRCFFNWQKIIIIFLVFFCISTSFAKAQFYETGQDPASVSWKQIKTKNYKLIFPEDFEANARLFASVLDTFIPVSSKYLLKKPRPISILFHTQSSLSNGLVVYAPKRMELFTIPPQDNYPQDWLEQLALHETRHVVQLDALNQGLTRFGSILIGQQAVGVVSAQVPRWFLEGDAVYSETLFSSAGRGRSASFQMPYRTLVLSSNLYSYEKALLGSYKDFVPDIYQMGYPIVKTMRDSFEQDIFGKSLRYTARNPYLIFPFGHSLKKTSGLNNRLSYQYSYKALKQSWQKHDKFDNYEYWPVKNTKTYTEYNLPIKIGDSLLVQKWSLSETRNFSIIDKNGKEKKLLTVGSNSGERLSFHGNKIAWSENKSDIRWQNRTFSEVMVFDLKLNKLKRLSKKSWYFSPAFSPDGKKLAVIEETPSYQCSLVILDANSGKVIQKTEAPTSAHLQHPQWSGDNEVYCLAVDNSGKSIIKLNASGIWETVLQPSFNNLSHFVFASNYIVFDGEYQGLNNLFAYSLENGKIQQVTDTHFGAFSPFFDEHSQRIYFSDYTPKGYRIASLPWAPELFPLVENYFEQPEKSDIFNLQNIKPREADYPVKNYSRFSHLFNIHSWIPAYYNYAVSDVTNPNVYPGFLIMSQDVLGTMVSSFGYSYEQGFSHLHANVSYKAFFPVITWSLNSGGLINRIGGNESIALDYSKNLQSVINISVPFNLSRGKMASGLTPYVEWKHNRDAYFVYQENQYYQSVDFINSGVNYYRYQKMAIRDLYPRWGFSSFFKMQSTPFENKLYHEIYAFSFRHFFPGFIRNHSFQLRYAYQHQSPLRYFYSSLISWPSGYHLSRTEELHVFNANYALPLVYPDIHLGPILYLKRIKANLFYEMASNMYHQPNTHIITHQNLRSVGTDLIADIHFLRILFPFQVGARFSYLPNEKRLFTEAIFSVNLVY